MLNPIPPVPLVPIFTYALVSARRNASTRICTWRISWGSVSSSTWRSTAARSAFPSVASASRCGAVVSSRRATAWPTRPEPPRIIAVRSRRSMQSLDGVDFVRREPAVLPLPEASQPHRPVGYAVQPLDFEPQRLGEAAHDALAPLGQGQLQLDAPPGRSQAELRHPHRPTVDRDRAPERRHDFGRW